ncbi:hypothetical protein ACFY71_29755 [Streptomyces cinerochromogenes]|uniref:hypothetical protein n=1 Tax=Streptomyces cinerochromogenes TaxID=66422 RepID=UPI0036B656EF
MTADTAWHKSACILCENNCGIQIQTDGRRFAKIRGDKEHVATAGYTCNKALRLDHAEPLRRSSRSTLGCSRGTRPCPTASASTCPPRTAQPTASASP